MVQDQEGPDGSPVTQNNMEAAKQQNLLGKRPYSLRKRVVTPKRYQ